MEKEQRIRDFEELGFGMFIHWGLYSQLGKGEWIQYFDKTEPSKYADLMDSFTAKEFDAKKIVATAWNAGMRYIVLTTRHHEGFSLYDTKGLTTFDAPHSAAKRDLIREFVDACKEKEIVPFLYHTTLDWHNPDYQQNFSNYLEYLRKSVEILCINYGEIGGFWFDGNWDQLDVDWEEEKLYSIIRKYQPNAIIANNPGWRFAGKLTHPEVDVANFEQGEPHKLLFEKDEKIVAGEMCQTINDHWGAGICDLNYKSVPDLIQTLCLCRGVGANYLLNVSLDGNGALPDMQRAMLEAIGEWSKRCNGAIYKGKPMDWTSSGKDFALQVPNGNVYLFLFDLSIKGNENVTINMAGEGPRVFQNVYQQIKSAKWLDSGMEIKWFQDTSSGMFCYHAAGFEYGYNLVVRIAELELEET